MEIVGIIAGALLGLAVGRVRTFHVAVQALVGLVAVAALVGLWHGLDSADASPYTLGLMAFALANLLSTFTTVRRTPVH